uniref:DUF4013 domain-containing protein n=1 Tax=Halorussus amylolyticus TaxID=1126242 RepID=UPI00138F03B7
RPAALADALGTTVVVFGGGTVVLFVSLTFAYLLPAALVEVARRGTLRAALEFGALGRTAFDAGYLLAWAAALALAGLSGALFGALAVLGRPGEVVALGVAVYAAVAVARLTGRAAR